MELSSQLAPGQKLELTVWDPADESAELCFASTLLEKKAPLILVAMSAKQQASVATLLERDVTVGVLVQADNPLIFYPQVERFQDQIPQGYWLRLPQNGHYEVIQRRAHVRVPMVVPLEVAYGDALEHTVKGMTVDAGGGGLKFTTPCAFEPGQALEVRLRFSASQPLLTLPAEILSCEANPLSRMPQDTYIAVCRFVDLSKAQQALVIKECFRRELLLKKR